MACSEKHWCTSIPEYVLHLGWNSCPAMCKTFICFLTLYKLDALRERLNVNLVYGNTIYIVNNECLFRTLLQSSAHLLKIAILHVSTGRAEWGNGLIIIIETILVVTVSLLMYVIRALLLNQG